MAGLAWTAAPARAQQGLGPLDYNADPSCPSAGDFSDEVAARIGYLPFGPAGDTEVKVRLVLQGDEVVGTLQLGETARVVTSSTCQEAFRGLAEALATHLNPPAPQTVPLPHVAPDTAEGLRVSVVGDEGTRLFQVDDRASAVGHSGSLTVYMESVRFHPLCDVPCTTQLPAGILELGAAPAGRPASPTTSFELSLDGPGELELHLENRRRLRIAGWITMIAGPLLGLGLVIYAAYPRVEDMGEFSPNVPLLAVGAGIAVASLVVGFVLRFQHDRVEWEFRPAGG